MHEIANLIWIKKTAPNKTRLDSRPEQLKGTNSEWEKNLRTIRTAENMQACKMMPIFCAV